METKHSGCQLEQITLLLFVKSFFSKCFLAKRSLPEGVDISDSYLVATFLDVKVVTEFNVHEKPSAWCYVKKVKVYNNQKKVRKTHKQMCMIVSFYPSDIWLF